MANVNPDATMSTASNQLPPTHLKVAPLPQKSLISSILSLVPTSNWTAPSSDVFSVRSSSNPGAMMSTANNQLPPTHFKVVPLPQNKNPITSILLSGSNVLQWLRENHCHQYNSVINVAEYLGHKHIATWARENGCPELVLVTGCG